MERKLVYGSRAINQILEIASYLSEHFSNQATNNFIDSIESIEEKILNYPESGRLSSVGKSVRYVLIGDHRRLYYKYNSKTVTILAVFDARQDPKKAPF